MPNFQDDLSQIATNPGLIMKALGAALGNYEANIGGTYVKLGPRLSGVGDVLLAGRGMGEEDEASREMSRLAQGGQGIAPMPPDSAGAVPSTPPGVSRAALAAQISPSMWKHLGRNRLAALNLDTIMSGQEQAAKQAAVYESNLPYMKALHGPEAGPSLARARAMAGTGMDKSMLDKPVAEVEAGRLKAQDELQAVAQEQSLRDSMMRNGINPKDPATMPMLDSILRKPEFARVNPMKLFVGDPQAAMAFMDRRLTADRERYRNEYGLDVVPSTKVDKEGNITMEILPREAEVAMAMVKQTAQEYIGRLTKLASERHLSPRYVESLTLPLQQAIMTGDKQALYNATHNAGVLLASMVKAESDGNLVAIQRKMQLLTLIENSANHIRQELKGNAEIAMIDRDSSQAKAQNKPYVPHNAAAYQRYQYYMARLKALDQANLAVNLAPSSDVAGMEQAYARAMQEHAGPPMYTDPASVPLPPRRSTETADQVIKRMIRDGIINGNDPVAVQRARDYWNQGR